MSVRPERLYELSDKPAHQIFAVIVDLYGRRMADDIAKKLLDRDYRPQAKWPECVL